MEHLRSLCQCILLRAASPIDIVVRYAFVRFYFYKNFYSLWNANFDNPDPQSFYSAYLAYIILEETNEGPNLLSSSCALL